MIILVVIVIIVLLFSIRGGSKRAARRQEQQMRQLVRKINPEAAIAEDREDRKVMITALVLAVLLFALFYATVGP